MVRETPYTPHPIPLPPPPPYPGPESSRAERPAAGPTVYMCPDCGGYGLTPVDVEHRPDCRYR